MSMPIQRQCHRGHLLKWHNLLYYPNRVGTQWECRACTALRAKPAWEKRYSALLKRYAAEVQDREDRVLSEARAREVLAEWIAGRQQNLA